MEEKIFIKNRNDKKVAVVVDENQKSKRLAFVVHGLGGFKEEPHIQAFAEAFKDNGFKDTQIVGGRCGLKQRCSALLDTFGGWATHPSFTNSNLVILKYFLIVSFDSRMILSR